MRSLQGDQCKSWLSKEKTKGQRIPMESINTRRKADVHRHVKMASHPESLFNTRPYPTSSNVAAEVNGKIMPIYIYIYIYTHTHTYSENNIRHMESRGKKEQNYSYSSEGQYLLFREGLFTIPLLSVKEKLNCIVCNNPQANSLLDNSDKITDSLSYPSGQVQFHH